MDATTFLANATNATNAAKPTPATGPSAPVWTQDGHLLGAFSNDADEADPAADVAAAPDPLPDIDTPAPLDAAVDAMIDEADALRTLGRPAGEC